MKLNIEKPKINQPFDGELFDNKKKQKNPTENTAGKRVTYKL